MNTNNTNMNDDPRRHQQQQDNDNNSNLPSPPAMAAAQAAMAMAHVVHHHHHDHDHDGNDILAAAAAPRSPTEDILNDLRMSHSDIIANRSSHHDHYDINNNDSPPAPESEAESAAPQFWQRVVPPPPVVLRGLLMHPTTNESDGIHTNSSKEIEVMKRRMKLKKRTALAVAGVGYPLPAYCNFVPGGIGYNHASMTIPESKVAAAAAVATTSVLKKNGHADNDKYTNEEDGVMVHLSCYCDTGMASSTPATAAATNVASPKASMARNVTSPKNNSNTTLARLKVDSTTTTTTASHAPSSSASGRPEIIIHRALLADITLRKYALHSLHQAEKNLPVHLHTNSNSGSNNGSSSSKSSPPPTLGQRLPSLSHLSHSALVNPLTAVSATHAVLWAESMILEYMDGRLECQLVGSPSSSPATTTDAKLLLMKMEYEEQMNRDLICPSTFSLDEGVEKNDENEKAASSRRLLQRAIASAWAQEEAMTGRTPTNNTANSSMSSTTNTTKVTRDNALVMELPTLKGLLQACWRVQRGEEVEEDEDDDAMKPTTTTTTPRGSSSSGSITTTTAAKNTFTGSPCGYVFRRGDIAWNCRTCQTDATCVLCDNCFRESDHVGHEVLFHRTTPGGCCDCGDLEAWNVNGMCPRHRPPPPQEDDDEGEDDEEEELDEVEVVGYGQERSAGGKRRKKKEGDITTPAIGGGGGTGGIDDDFEAVRAAQRTRLDHERHVDGIPAKNVTVGNATPRPLPPRLAAALATVIASTIQSILIGVEGSAIGADVSQWRLQWADEICKIWNGVSEDEEYYRRGAVLWERLIDEKRRSKMKDNEMMGRSSPSSSSSSAIIEEEIANEMEIEKDRLWAHPRHILDSHNEHYASELPPNYQLLLRLHNDDVHTFEEVINALHSKSDGPIPVPVGGRGSVGEVGGAGVSGEELKALSSAVASAEESRNNAVNQSQRNRPFAEDPDSTQQQRRVYRTYSSSNSSSGGSRGGGISSSPISNRSPTNNSIGGTNGLMVDAEDTPLSPTGMQFVSEVDPSAALIAPIDVATDLTRKVDADGQVSVRAYETINDAGIGFSRLRESAGLHCEVLTSARIESEERAKVLLEWLGSLIGSHPAVSAMIVQCLVDVTEGDDVLCGERNNKTSSIPGKCRGVAGWLTPKMMPCWSGTSELWSGKESRNIIIPAWRRRFDAFPPYLESSYLTREEGRELFRLGMMSEESDSFIDATGKY